MPELKTSFFSRLRRISEHVLGISSGRMLAGLFIVSLTARLIAMHFVVLLPEEAYYWMYAQNPDLSYFDHPPMVSWVIGLGTWFFGDTEFGVRIVGNVLMCGASMLLYLHARIWFGVAASLVSALSLHVLPVFAAAGFIATMDSSLVFFWTLGLLGVSLALKRGCSSGWLLAGIGCGGAMLSKYTGVFIGVGALVAVVSHPAWRRQLLTVHPYLAAAISLALFSPVIIWNARHDWASFRFQFMDRFEGRGFKFEHVADFVGQEFAVATPLILVMIIWLVYRNVRRPRRLWCPRTMVAFAFSLPLLLVMAYKSLRYPIHVNWTMPAYLSLIPLVGHILVSFAGLHAQRFRRGIGTRVRRWPTALGWTGIIALGFNIAAFGILLFLQPHYELVSGFGRWRQLAAIVEEHEDAFEAEGEQPILVLGDGRYRLASVLAFYRMPIEDRMNASDQSSNQMFLGKPGLGYAYWMVPKDWIGRDLIYVDSIDNPTLKKLRRFFKSVEMAEDARLAALGYQLAICRDYKGLRRQ